MTIYYLDSSALVKRYVTEPGSAWVSDMAVPAAGHTIVVADITRVEVAAALAACERAPNGLSRRERDDAVDVLLKHCDAEYQVASLNRTIIGLAVDLTQHHRLRGYDAVQLATALTVHESLLAAGLLDLTFVAADDDLVGAARAEGLAADNPNHHR